MTPCLRLSRDSLATRIIRTANVWRVTHPRSKQCSKRCEMWLPSSPHIKHSYSHVHLHARVHADDSHMSPRRRVGERGGCWLETCERHNFFVFTFLTPALLSCWFSGMSIELLSMWLRLCVHVSSEQLTIMWLPQGSNRETAVVNKPLCVHSHSFPFMQNALA